MGQEKKCTRKGESSVLRLGFWWLTFFQVCATACIIEIADAQLGLLNPEMITGLIILHSERCALSQGEETELRLIDP